MKRSLRLQEADIYIGVPASREEDYAPCHEIDLKKIIRESLKPASTRFIELMKTLNMFRKLLGSIKPTFKQYYGWFGYGALYSSDSRTPTLVSGTPRHSCTGRTGPTALEQIFSRKSSNVFRN